MLDQILALISLYDVSGFRGIQQLEVRVQLVKFDHFVRNLARWIHIEKLLFENANVFIFALDLKNRHSHFNLYKIPWCYFEKFPSLVEFTLFCDMSAYPLLLGDTGICIGRLAHSSMCGLMHSKHTMLTKRFIEHWISFFLIAVDPLVINSILCPLMDEWLHVNSEMCG
jgi:hypothetical protein